MKKFALVLLYGMFVFTGIAHGEIQPPVGSISSKDLSASFVLYDDHAKQITAMSVDYNDKEITIDSFPGDAIWMYYKLSQTNSKDGFLLIKIIREYMYLVEETAKGKVRIIHNDGFYAKNEVFSSELTKQYNGKNLKKRFSISQYMNFTKKKASEGIESFLDLYWEKSTTTHVGREDLRKYFAFNDYEKQNMRLHSCMLIHHLPFNGSRYIRIEVPMADKGNNLEKVYVEVVEIRENGFYDRKRYLLKDY